MEDHDYPLTLVAPSEGFPLVLEHPLPAQLDGLHGRNRAQGIPQISAVDDRSAVLAWLDEYRDSPATFASYRKEAERLVMWCLYQRGLALSDLRREDLREYEMFLKSPQPSEMWVMAPSDDPNRGVKKHPRASKHWRPFAGPLSHSSQRQAMLILNGLFTWLARSNYLAGNPLLLSRTRRESKPNGVSRYLPMAHWNEVRQTIQEMPIGSVKQRLQAARARWVFALLYSGGLRVSELCSTRMGAFHSQISPDGTIRWWLTVDGKGNKVAKIPATDEMVSELKRYRQACGLTALPNQQEQLPLVMPVIGLDRALKDGMVEPLNRGSIDVLVKNIARNTAARIRGKNNPDLEDAAAHIERMSTHWMRHTAGTHLSERADIKVVRDNLRHSNISTTSIYLHSEDDARHDATNLVHRAGWEA